MMLLTSLLLLLLPLLSSITTTTSFTLQPNLSLIQHQSNPLAPSLTKLNLTPDITFTPIPKASKIPWHDTKSFSQTANAASLKKKNLQTFARHIEIESWKRPEVRRLEPVLAAAARACTQISRMVQRAQTDDMYGAAVNKATGLAKDENVQGEAQQKLDVVCNDIMTRAFCSCSDEISCIASEEDEEVMQCSSIVDRHTMTTGEYVAVFDPLDGSKNIDSSLPVGTIFGIYKYKNTPPAGNGTFLQQGMHMVAAGYCLYSATTVMVLTMGSGVDGFTLDPDRGEFLHTHKDMRIPKAGNLVCFNEANAHEFDEPVQRYLQDVKTHGVNSHETGKKQKASGRYVGAMVADVHNVLINGGIYGYPATKKSPDGKLRLLYECNPMAMIVEQAGGAGSTGFGRILEVVPTGIHQRTPTFLGSVENVYELEMFYRYHGLVEGEDVVVNGKTLTKIEP